MGQPHIPSTNLNIARFIPRSVDGVLQNLVRCLIYVLLTASFTASGIAQIGRNADVLLISERVQVTPGEELYLALDMRIRKDWHVYWRNPGDAGLSPRINWLQTPNVEVGEFVWPIPSELLVKKDEIMDYGYEDKLILPFRIRIPEDAVDEIILRGEADYLICKKVCIPEITPVHLRMLVGDSPIDNYEEKKEIDESLTLIPTNLNGSATIDTSESPWLLEVAINQMDLEAVDYVRFFPYGHEITHAAQQPYAVTENKVFVSLTPSRVDITQTLSGVLVFETDTEERFGTEIQANQGTVFVKEPSGTLQPSASPELSIPMVELIIICFLALLGGLILNLMPCVLPVLSIKAFGMLQVATSGRDNALKLHGLLYTLGVLASFLILALGFLAVRSSTGSANLGFQLQEPWIVTFLALVMFFIGLWFAGLFELGSSVQNFGSSLANREGGLGAFSSGVLAAVVGAPCVGPFLGVALGAVVTQPGNIVLLVFLVLGFGFALPFLLLSFMPTLMRLLPKPGPWMDTLKQLFSFPMFLTSAWLLAVLGALTDYMTVISVFVTIIGIWFLIWLLRKIESPIHRVFVVIGMFSGIVIPALLDVEDILPEQSVQAEKVETGNWSPEKVEELIEEGRGIFVDFTAVWCATCQFNKRTTLQRLSVRQAFAETGTVFLTADFTKKNSLIAEELKKYARPGVPMYLYYAPGSSIPSLLPEILNPKLVIGLVESNEM